MKSIKIKKTNMYIHPLEESVLSLATDKIVQLDKDIMDTLKVIPGDQKIPEKKSEFLEIDPHRRIESISRTINQSIRFVSDQVLGRWDVIKQSFLALMTGEHQLLISRTGMAKSFLVRQIFSCFENTQIFEKQLTKKTMPENLFGAYDIEAMRKGNMVYNVHGSLVLSHFAFLDNIFDANNLLLRSLLSLLNEKQIISSTLHSVIAASNHIRVKKALESVIDRFMYKSFISESNDSYLQYSIDQIYQEHFGAVTQPEKRVTFGEISFIKKLIQSRQIKIPGYVLFLKNHILRKYIEETRSMATYSKDFTISGRKRVKIQDTLRALAILDGRPQVEEKDLDSLYYAVCVLGKRDQKARIERITDAAKSYFRHDRDILENIFNAIYILSLIKKCNNGEILKSDKSLYEVKNRLEKVIGANASIFREYFNRLGKKLMAFSRDTFIPETFTMLDSICELSLKDVKTWESREIISGFREDIFKSIKNLRF